jgi:hypothetical protein
MVDEEERIIENDEIAFEKKTKLRIEGKHQWCL